MASAKRRFEFVAGNSNKFWEIQLNGNEVLVQFGRIGTTGQGERKTFPDPAAATKHAQKKIDEKVKKKGYVEVP